MGTTISRMFYKLFCKKESKLLMISLVGAGQTTILSNLKLGGSVECMYPIGYCFETISFQNFKLTAFGIGRWSIPYKIMKKHSENSECVIFVVDSSDCIKIDKARKELHRILTEEELKGAPVLVIANKQDIAVMNIKEVIEKLDLKSLDGRSWHCQGTSAISG